MVRADKAYYRTHRGDVVGGDHPDRVVLICKPGELVDGETAREVGLIEPVGNPVKVEAPALAVEAGSQVQAVTEPPTTQAVEPPTRAKAKAKAPKTKAKAKA